MKPFCSSLAGFLFALALSAPAASASTTIVDLNGAFTTLVGPGSLAVHGDLATSFGTTSSYGIPNVGGVNRQVLSFAAPAAANANGLQFTHGSASPNTAGYSLLWDVYYPNIPNYVSLVQVDNGGDGDLFARSSGAIGISGTYNGTTFTAGEWHRVILTVNSGHNELSIYVDGSLINSYGSADPDRYDLSDPSFLLFADEDNETAPGYLSLFGFTDTALSAPEVAGLGSAGSPIPGVPEPAGAMLLSLAGAATLARRRK